MKWSNIAEKTILLFFDEKSNFEEPKTQQKLAKELFKDLVLIQSLADFEKFITSQKENQEILFFIHLNHNKSNKGHDDFKASKIKIQYPNLRSYYISSVPKKTIFEQGNDSFDVFSYDGFHDKIGDSFLPQSISELKSNNKLITPVKKGIFLSHSSKDSEVVNKFRELILESGLGYNPNLIKFTSAEDHGIPSGINIPVDLRNFLNNDMGLFIQFLTPNYEKSRVCLNEEGAAWCILDDDCFIPIIIPPNSSNLISWVKNGNKGIKLNDKGSLVNIYQDRREFFSVDVNITKLTNKIDEFIEFVNDLSKE